MKNTTKQLKIWRIVAVTALLALVTVSILYAFGMGYKCSSPTADTNVLSLWNDGTGAKKSLTNYVTGAFI